MDNNSLASIGLRIQKARIARGMNQTELAETLGVKPQAIQHWERGTAQPKTSRIPDIAKALSVQTAWLLSNESVVANDHGNLSISHDEEFILNQYRKMDETRQKIFEEIAFVLANQANETTSTSNSPKK